MLAGGGIDSSLCIQLLVEAGRIVRPLHIDYGQPSAAEEWRAVTRIASQFDLDADQVAVAGKRNPFKAEVPGRNAALVFIGLMHMRESEHVLCLGIHAGTPFYDCTESFFNLVSRLVVEQTNAAVRLVAPILQMQKSEIATMARAKRLDIDGTYSCQVGRSVPCGNCLSCRDRKAVGC